MNVEGSLSSIAPVLVTRRYHILDNSQVTGRKLTASCKTFTTFGVELATNGTFKYLHLSFCCIAPTVQTNNSGRQTGVNGGNRYF